MITNARDAMKPDGGALTIELRKRNDNIEIIFADTGGGIPDEIKGSIFEPFVTTKGALGQSEIPGTGLGLFFSIGIISRYHGKIEVESKVGKGSKFTIKIPVTQNQQLPDRAEAEDEGPTVLPPNLNILLVDDEEAICNVVKKFLEEKGYSVVDTTSGKKGLKLFKDKSFDLVLSDITMPDMDGVKLISELKSIDPAIKLVTLTGHVAEKKLEAARKAGADQILLKPFKKEDLYRAIGRALSV
jgi:CheY-like chemotaxis protein